METLMQLIYLSFVHPRFDQGAYDAFIIRYRAYVKNMGVNPQKIMSDSLSLIQTNYHPRTRILDMKYIDDIHFEWVEKVYRDRFADASDFIFVIVGNMEAEEVKMLVQKYIGAIPDLDRKETWIDRKVREPQGIVEKRIPVALETPKANVNIVINKLMEYNAYNRMLLRVIEGILDLRFTESIREKEGGTYGVGIRTNLVHWPLEQGHMQIRFDCDPEKAEDLKAKVYKELEKLAKNGPSQEDLSKTVENLLKTREQSKEHNAYYLNTIYDYYVNGINNDDPANYENILDKLTVKDVKKGMKTFYKGPNIVDVVFVPLEEESSNP
jgi:zinc protease